MAAYCSGIRICILHRWTSVQGWGFTLHSAPNRRGARYIAAVQPYSPAACTGLRPGDRIVEVNYKNICSVEHDEVVSIIESCEDTMMLLVVDAQTDIAYQNMHKCIHSNLPDILLLACPRTEPESAHERKGERHDISLEDDAERLNEAINHVDDILPADVALARKNGKDDIECFMADPDPEDERPIRTGQSSEGMTSSKNLLFAKLRRILRPGHRKRDDNGRFTSSPAAEGERKEGVTTSLPHAVEPGKGGATSLPPVAECGEGRATSLPPAAEQVEGGASSLLTTSEREDGGATSSSTAEQEKCGTTPSAIIDPHSGKEPLMEIIHRMLSRRGRDTSDRRCIPLINAGTRQLLSPTSQPAEREASSLPPFAERDECAAISSTSTTTRSGKEPLIERIHRTNTVDQETMSTAAEPATLSNADKLPNLSSAGKSVTLSLTSGPAPATSSTTFSSTFSIRLKPAPRPQRKHVLYQLLTLPPSSKVERRRLCGSTLRHAAEPATTRVPATLPAVLRKYWNIKL